MVPVVIIIIIIISSSIIAHDDADPRKLNMEPKYGRVWVLKSAQNGSWLMFDGAILVTLC